MAHPYTEMSRGLLRLFSPPAPHPRAHGSSSAITPTHRARDKDLTRTEAGAPVRWITGSLAIRSLSERPATRITSETNGA